MWRMDVDRFKQDATEAAARAVFIGTPGLVDLSPHSLERRLAAARTVASVTRLSPDSGSGGVLVAIADRLYSVLALPFPVPAADLSLAVATAYGWSAAAAGVGAAKAHLLVARLGAVDLTPMEGAAELTAVAAALLEEHAANFVYWQAGDALSSPEAFRQAAHTLADEGRPPLLAWVQFRLIRSKAAPGAPRFGMVTRGLAPLIGAEIMLPATCPQPALAGRILVKIAGYALESGERLGEGDRVDVEGLATVKIGSRSNSPDGIPVIQLELNSREFA